MSRIDPATDAVVTSDQLNGDIAGLAIGEGWVWASLTNGGLVRIDPATATVDRRYSLSGGPQSMDVIDGRIWWVHNSELTALPAGDIGGGRRRIDIGDGFTRVAADPAHGFVWALNPGAGTLVRVTVGLDEISGTLVLGGQPGAMVVDADAVWIVDSVAATVVQIDPLTATVVETIPIDRVPVAVRPTADGLWVGLADGGGLIRLGNGTGHEREITLTAPGNGMVAGSQIELVGTHLWWNDLSGQSATRLDLSGAPNPTASESGGPTVTTSAAAAPPTSNGSAVTTTTAAAPASQAAPAASADGADVVSDQPAASSDATSQDTLPHVDSPSPPLPPEPTEAPTP